MTKNPIKELLKKIFYKFAIESLHSANRQIGRLGTIKKISSIVPNIGDQYSTWNFETSNTYDVIKIRSIHAFQVEFTLAALKKLRSQSARNALSVVDIGDSSGTHTRYLQALCSELDMGEVEFLSVNLDSDAVERILAKGGRAIRVRAEDLHQAVGYQNTQIFTLRFKPLSTFRSDLMLA